MAKRTTTIPTYRLYGEKFDLSPDFWIHGETIPERTHLHNFEIAPHRHSQFFQIFRLTAGSGEVRLGDDVRQLVAPCALFLPPSQVHGFGFARDVDGFVVTAFAERLASLAAADRQVELFSRAPHVVDLGGATELTAALDMLDREVAHAAPARAVMLDALMTAAIVGLMRAVRAGEDADDSADRDGRRMAALLDLVALHMRAHRPVEFYAERLGVSATHLNRITRRQAGMGVAQLIAARLLEAARRDLVFTPTSVQKVAYSLGFADPAYFNRFFRRMTGTTPGAFREAERQRPAA